jgi:hypothetical protein
MDWAKSLDDSSLIPTVEGEKTVYLVPEFDTDQDAEKLLRTVYSEIFERELFAWHTDQSDWPQKRNYAMFKQWFKVELHSMIEDLCSDPIEDDEGDA